MDIDIIADEEGRPEDEASHFGVLHATLHKKLLAGGGSVARGSNRLGSATRILGDVDLCHTPRGRESIHAAR